MTHYAVPMRLFSIITVILGIMLGPLWPAYGEALARQDFAWVKSALRRSIVVSTIIALPFAIILVIFGNEIIELWVGPSVKPTMLLMIGMGVWTILFSVLNPMAMFLNGASIIKLQIITASAMTILNLALSIVLVQCIGVAGAIWGTVISLTVCTLLPTLFYILRYLKI